MVVFPSIGDLLLSISCGKEQSYHVLYVMDRKPFIVGDLGGKPMVLTSEEKMDLEGQVLEFNPLTRRFHQVQQPDLANPRPPAIWFFVCQVERHTLFEEAMRRKS